MFPNRVCGIYRYGAVSQSDQALQVNVNQSLVRDDLLHGTLNTFFILTSIPPLSLAAQIVMKNGARPSPLC